MHWLPTLLQLPSVRTPLAISLGAIAGALSRYYIGLFFMNKWGIGFPYGTMFINLTGSCLMGFFVELFFTRTNIAPDLRMILTVGFLGSYTTFSTYSLETLSLFKNENLLRTLIYWLGSSGLGVTFAWIGTAIAASLPNNP
jgi:CrcB protein